MKKRFITILAFLIITSNYAQKTIKLNKFLRSNIGFINLWDSNSTRIYGITDALAAAPQIPSTPIICNEGDTVILNTLSISQGHHHTIHLHGLDVDTRNDGDPMTSFALSHMQDTTYTFVGTHAGTYIYHCHVGDVAHVQMGMYGLVIVKAKDGLKTAWTNGPAYDKEYGWITNEIDKSWHDTIPEHDPATDMVRIPKYVPDYFIVNGKSRQQIWADSLIYVQAKTNEKVYVRLCNIGFSDNKYIFPGALNSLVIDSDGRPLPNVIRTDTVLVSPGERYGVMLTPIQILNDSIRLEFSSLNTYKIQGVEMIPVHIEENLSVTPIHLNNPLKLFPNPVQNTLNIESEFMIAEIRVVNQLGLQVISEIIPSPSKQIVMHISALAPGIYSLIAKHIDGLSVQQFIVY